MTEWISQLTLLDQGKRYADRFDYIEKILAYLKANNLPAGVELNEEVTGKLSTLHNSNNSLRTELKPQSGDLEIVRIQLSVWESNLQRIHGGGAMSFQESEKLRKEIHAAGIECASDLTNSPYRIRPLAIFKMHLSKPNKILDAFGL